MENEGGWRAGVDRVRSWTENRGEGEGQQSDEGLKVSMCLMICSYRLTKERKLRAKAKKNEKKNENRNNERRENQSHLEAGKEQGARSKEQVQSKEATGQGTLSAATLARLELEQDAQGGSSLPGAKLL